MKRKTNLDKISPEEVGIDRLERLMRELRPHTDIVRGIDEVIRKVKVHDRSHEGCCIKLIEDILLDYGIWRSGHP